MTPELHYLVYSVVLGLVLLVAASHAISSQYGYAWTASNRDQPMPPLKGIVGRIDRALINFLGVLWRSYRPGHYSSTKHIGIEMAEIYWHFVDIIWIISFPIT